MQRWVYPQQVMIEATDRDGGKERHCQFKEMVQLKSLRFFWQTNIADMIEAISSGGVFPQSSTKLVSGNMD